MRADRPEANIPTPTITISLLLAAGVRLPSVLQLKAETQRAGWQRLVCWKGTISDDAFDYAVERYEVDDLRQVLVRVNRRLKENKQLETAKIRFIRQIRSFR